MEKTTGLSVEYQEATAIKVAHWLHQKKCVPAHPKHGWELTSVNEMKAIGILRNVSETKPRKHFFGLITSKPEPRFEFFGVVNFIGERWIFEVYGRKHVDVAKELATEMSSDFNVSVTVRLVQDTPKEQYVDLGDTG